MNNLEEQILLDLSIFIEKLYNTLVLNGVTPKDKKISTLVNCVENLYCINPNKKYCGFQLNDKGFIEKAIHLDKIVVGNVLPKYIEKGFYYIEDGKIKESKDRKLELYPDNVTF